MDSTKEAIKSKDTMLSFMQSVAETKKSCQVSKSLEQHDKRVATLIDCAQRLDRERQTVLKANAIDIECAKDESPAIQDRLLLNDARIDSMIAGLEAVANQPDPLYQALGRWERPNGLVIERMSTPIGCLGIIFEARPNVTIDAAALCIKSGNAAVLRPGRTSFESAKALLKLVQDALYQHDLPKNMVIMPPTSDRAYVEALLTMEDCIDLIVPRGGKKLIDYVNSHARMPVLSHREGNCHIYVHEDADLNVAQQVIYNSKMRRVSVCGALESLLIHAEVAPRLIPILYQTMIADCLLRACPRSLEYEPRMEQATEADWSTEYLAPILSIKIVDGLDDAVSHINHYGSHHTDAIMTQDEEIAKIFAKNVDSAIIMHNASTQFADGGEFGFGAEIGIATGCLPPRGPVGPQQLTSYRYRVLGHGQTRP